MDNLTLAYFNFWLWYLLKENRNEGKNLKFSMNDYMINFITSGTASCGPMSCRTTSCGSVPCGSTSCESMSCKTTSCGSLPCGAVLCSSMCKSYLADLLHGLLLLKATMLFTMRFTRDRRMLMASRINSSFPFLAQSSILVTKS